MNAQSGETIIKFEALIRGVRRGPPREPTLSPRRDPPFCFCYCGRIPDVCNTFCGVRSESSGMSPPPAPTCCHCHAKFQPSAIETRRSFHPERRTAVQLALASYAALGGNTGPGPGSREAIANLTLLNRSLRYEAAFLGEVAWGF